MQMAVMIHKHQYVLNWVVGKLDDSMLLTQISHPSLLARDQCDYCTVVNDESLRPNIEEVLCMCGKLILDQLQLLLLN